MNRRTQRTELKKKGKSSEPDSDYKLFIVLGAALLLALLIIAAIMLTSGTTIT
jgi:hypothetical protein